VTEGRGAVEVSSAAMEGWRVQRVVRTVRSWSGVSVSRRRGNGRGRAVVFVRNRFERREGVGVPSGREDMEGEGVGEEDMLSCPEMSSVAFRFRFDWDVGV